jgi:chromosome segregation ATPase
MVELTDTNQDSGANYASTGLQASNPYANNQTLAAPAAEAQEEEEEEEEAYYENPLEIIREFGNHPLMDRAQKALTKELKDTNYRLLINLRDKKDELRNLTLEREGLGVQLYSLQQQLARIQLTLENAHNEHNRLVDARLADEEILRDVNKNNTEQTAMLGECEKQFKKHSHELDALNETIRQIEQYNDQVKSEIAINRRATYKVEQNMQELEKIKETQDYYVDDLTKQINKLKEQIEFINQQYEIQKKDTYDANGVIQDTVKELELIGTEKQQLMIQWKAALSGLSRRDEALAQATQTLAVAESSVHDYDVEIEAARREMQREQAKHESLVSLRDRLENELAWVEENLNKLKLERSQMQERYTLLSKSLAQTDHENKKLDLLTKQLDNETESIIQNIQSILNDRQLLEDELQLLYSTHSNVNKAVSNLGKDAQKIVKLIHEKENEANEIENQIARTKVDRLTVQSTNDQLKEQLEGFVKELKEKETLTNKYQLEIRQRNDEIEKKMYRVDRLNKKYEKMVESAGGEENLGPLENTIKNLAKELENIDMECKELEREWLRKQTDMVNMSAECEGLNEKNNEQQARVTVVSQQQLRFMKDLRELKSNVKVANLMNQDYQKDVSKLNALISDNHDQETELQAQNFVIEMDCMEELKDAERDCVQLQASINENKNAKTTVLDEIVEMERQAMLWEKKIQLDKETRQALDPSVGASDNANMEKEIHRMELRLEALKREQERLSVEMEKAIQKRATIAIRYNGNSGGGSGGASGKGATGGSTKFAGTATVVSKEMTQATAKKQIAALKKEARILAEETSQYNSMYEEKKNKLEEMGYELERVTAQYGEAEETCHVLQTNINEMLYQKQLLQERIAYRQKYTSRLRELSQTGIDLSQALPIERKLLSSSQALDNVKEIIEELQSSFPHLNEVLQRVSVMADASIPVVMQ